MSEINWNTTAPNRPSRHAYLPGGFVAYVTPYENGESIVTVARMYRIGHEPHIGAEVRMLVPDGDVDSVIPKLVDIVKTIPTRLP
jgi:hypothetical protein